MKRRHEQQEHEKEDTRMDTPKVIRDDNPTASKDEADSRLREVRRDMREGRIVTWDDTVWMVERLEAISRCRRGACLLEDCPIHGGPYMDSPGGY